jgi:hypothetical protein
VSVQGTKVVTVRISHIVRVRVRQHGRLVWTWRRITYEQRKRILYRHPERVVYYRRVPVTICPPLPSPSPAPAPSSTAGSGASASKSGASAAPTIPPLQITTTSLPLTAVGDTYSAQLTASGGTAPYTWSITSGSLPSGISLSSDGSLSGTALVAGTASFAVEIADATAPAPETASALLSISVAPFPGQMSTNWAGYIWPSSSLVTAVSGTFTVPALNCSATPDATAAYWVGIGGVSYPTGSSSGPLLQTGITSQCTNGLQENVPWWEEVPSSPNNAADFSSMPISTGDVIDVSVSEATSGSWMTFVCDLSTGTAGVMVTNQSWGVGPDPGCAPTSVTYSVQGSTTDLSYSGGYTGEWVVEDPTDATTGNELPFANFGTVGFTNLGLAPGPWSSGASDPQDGLELVEAGQVLALPSWQGNDLTVTYTG